MGNEAAASYIGIFDKEYNVTNEKLNKTQDHQNAHLYYSGVWHRLFLA